MSITGQLKALYTKSLHIYTGQDISNHINTTSSAYTHSLKIVKTVQKKCFTNQEAFFKKMRFRFFLKERDGVLKTVIGRKFQILAAWKWKDVSSRLKVSFGEFQQFFTAGPKSWRGLVDVKQFWKVRRKKILKVPESQCGNFVVDTGLNREPVSHL